MYNLPPFFVIGEGLIYDRGVRPVDEHERNNVIFKATSTYLRQTENI